MKYKNKIYHLAIAALMIAGTLTPSVHAVAQMENVGVRTNALTWIALSPSLGFDVQLDQQWQANFDLNIPIVSAGHNRIHMSGFGSEIRRYFGPSYQGLYMGLGARYLKYNKQFNNDPGRDGKLMLLGLTGGYVFDIGKRWSIDTNIGLGYVQDDYSRYDWYNPRQENRLLYGNVSNRFGLTNAELSIVYHFCINGNKCK